MVVSQAQTWPQGSLILEQSLWLTLEVPQDLETIVLFA